MTANLRYFNQFIIRPWQPTDREIVANIISSVLAEYGLNWEPTKADRDVVEIEEFYLATGGEFWVIEQDGIVIGTAGYYPVKRGKKAVEIRKMYLLPSARRKGLGKYLLQELETAIEKAGFETIWVETASILKSAVILYENSGYQSATGVETQRCDRIYVKYLNNKG